MQRLVSFVDESGIPVECQYFAVGIVYTLTNHSYTSIGLQVLEKIKRRIGVRGEVKFRRIRKKIIEEVLEIISREFRIYSSYIHVSEDFSREEFLIKLLSNLPVKESKVIVVLDVMPVKMDKLSRSLRRKLREKGAESVYIVFRNSRRIPGIQLADIVAGFTRRYRRNLRL